MPTVATRLKKTERTVSDPDVELMLRVQQDEPGAFDELTAQYWSRLFGRFFRQFHDRQEAEDLAQDVFLRVYRNRKRYRPQAKFTTWFYHIARNVARNAIRTRNRRHVVPLTNLPLTDGMPLDRPTREPSSPSLPLERAETAGVVRSAVSGLQGRQRRAIELQTLDHSYAEIADELDMTTKAAKSLLYRARNELRITLTPFVHAAG